MGLLEIVFIFTGIYWVSYFISLFITSSIDYKELKIPLRITLGFFYFSFANSIFFKVFSIQVSVFLSLILLFGIGFLKNKTFLVDSFSFLKTSIRPSFFYFLFYFLVLNIFLLPMHISKHYTAFTEKGGDITIYSDISKYLVEHKEPAFGFQDGYDDLKGLFSVKFTHGDNLKDYRDVELLDPPHAEYAAYRTIATKWYTASQIVHTSQWFFLSNNHTFLFYTVLAFIYASIVALFFAFTIDFGKIVAFITFLLILLSPSLISIFYNLYLLHVFSVLCMTLAFSLILNMKFKSISIHSDLALVFLILFSSYYPALPTIAFPYFVFILSNVKEIKVSELRLNNSFSGLQRLFLSLFFLILLSWILLDIFGTSLKKVLAYIIAFITADHQSDELNEVYLGKAISVFSEKSFSFFSGLMSQDHYPPFFPKIELLEKVSNLNFIVFSLILFLSAVNFIRGIIKKAITGQLIFFILTVSFTIIFYAYISKGFLYMQSKSAQYNLIPLYFVLIVLNQQLLKITPKSYLDRIFVSLVFFLFLIQIVIFAIPRYYFLVSVSNSTNLSCVMEDSFYEKTKDIDKDSLTLIEVEKAGCIYFITQPFFGKKILPVKHLSLQKVNCYLKEEEYDFRPISGLTASDFIEVGDSSEKIVYLYPEKIIKKEVKHLGFKTEVEWGKKIMGQIKSPELVLTADYFEKNFRTTTNGNYTKKIHYSRAGNGLIFFPSSEKNQEVLIEVMNAREETKTTIKSENIKFKAKSKYVESINLVENPKFVQVKILLKENKAPFLLHLPKLDQEYLISVETLNQSL